MPSKAITPPAEKTKAPHVTRDKASGNYIVTLTDGCFSQETRNLATSGFFLDVLALSAKCWEQNEMDENNFEYQCENENYVLEHFNFEDAFIEYLNTHEEYALNCTHFSHTRAWTESDLMTGAWLALNAGDAFRDALNDWTDKLKEQAAECMGDYSTDCEALNEELQESYDGGQEDLYHDWLHGDYRNGAGILKEAQKYHGFEDVDFTEGTKEKPATIRIEVTEQWVRDAEGWDDTGKVTKAIAGESVVSTISYRAASYVKEEQAKRAARREEREKIAKYQAEQKKQEEQARRDKLQAMKRA